MDSEKTGNNRFKILLLKYPAVFTVLPLATGICINYLPGIHFNISDLVLIVLQLLLLFISLYLISKLRSKSLRHYIIFFIFVLVFGFVRFQYFYNNVSGKNISLNIDSLKDKTVLIYGTLLEQPDLRENSLRLIIQSDSLVYGGKLIPCEGNVIATVYKNKFSEFYSNTILRKYKFEYGDKISIEGTLESLPHRRNPGEFDYGEYLKLHGIDAGFTAFGYDKIGLTGKSDPNFFKKNIIYPVKNYSLQTIDSLVGGDEGEFLKGLVLGERSNISNEIKQNFVKAGVSHIIAVSGLNVAYVLIILNGLLLIFPIKRQYKVFIIILCLLFYMNLTGNVPSIVRATVMAIVFLLSQILERKPLPYNIIAVSALAILIINPMQLFDTGFILSYGAILSIVIFYPELVAMLNRLRIYRALDSSKFTHKSIRSAILLILGTLAAQIGTLPITALMFKKISVISLLTNLVAIPVSNIALAMGFIMVIFSTFSLWLAEAFAISSAFILHWLLWFIDYFANFDFSFIETFNVDAFVFVFYYVVIFLLFSIKKVNLKPRLAFVTLLILNLLVYKSYLGKNENVRLTYLDVGNSSSCLITLPGNKYNILVNEGTSTAKYTSAERNVIPYLKSRGVNCVDELFITNLNKDEFRNLIYFINNFPVRKISLPIYYEPVFTGNEFKKFFSGKNIEFITGSKVKGDYPNSRFYICYLNEGSPSPSMLVKFLYGGKSFTFSDTRNISEDYFYSITCGSTNVQRVPFSGSFNYSSPESIVRTNPTFAVISSSKSSKRLNSDIFSKSLEHIGICVLKIADRGAVIFETDGVETKLVDWN